MYLVPPPNNEELSLTKCHLEIEELPLTKTHQCWGAYLSHSHQCWGASSHVHTSLRSLPPSDTPEFRSFLSERHPSIEELTSQWHPSVEELTLRMTRWSFCSSSKFSWGYASICCRMAWEMAGIKLMGFRSRSSHKISANCSGVIRLSVNKKSNTD